MQVSNGVGESLLLTHALKSWEESLWLWWLNETFCIAMDEISVLDVGRREVMECGRGREKAWVRPVVCRRTIAKKRGRGERE